MASHISSYGQVVQRTVTRMHINKTIFARILNQLYPVIKLKITMLPQFRNTTSFIITGQIVPYVGTLALASSYKCSLQSFEDYSRNAS